MIELVDYIRLLSRDGRLVTADQIIAVAGLELEIEDINAAYQTLIEDEQYADIVIIEAKDDFYFYSKKYIVKSYAVQWIGVHNGDLLDTIANEVRRYSELGEVIPASNFTHPPYNLEKAELGELLGKFQAAEGFDDIGMQTSNDGVEQFFSTKFITIKYASVLGNVDPFEYSA
ncbi:MULTISPECIES: hypothetical protein [Shewanella]|uniref:hypothetical protein n=1 Tax=unclassified Shewanella TaxID=196818 RepID=UPI0010C112CF|nr:hypothetical protein [Shewanella sp. MEBiC00475]